VQKAKQAKAVKSLVMMQTRKITSYLQKICWTRLRD